MRFRPRFVCVLFMQCVFSVTYGSILFVIIDQPSTYHRSNAQKLAASLTEQSATLGLQMKVLRTTTNFSEYVGAWTVWPLVTELVNQINLQEFNWFFVCEDETLVNVSLLKQLLAQYDPQKDWFMGYALRDQNPTIIHHYAFINNPDKFAYPDFARGFVLSKSLLLKLRDTVQSQDFQFNFAIDAKHELAMLLSNNKADASMIHIDQFCLDESSGCITSYKPNYHLCSQELSIAQNFNIAVKTCQKFHETRIVAVKNTWAKESDGTVEYYSDANDPNIPTKQVKVRNTDRGHCGKTMTIFNIYAENFEANKHRWLIIVDDDTIISLKRLRNLLKCYNMDEKLIIGERYGYGFSANGRLGYDYPTGGSGMAFSPSAAKLLSENCNCPALDSPDDMIIGMCAANLHIPIIHNAAFHQARPNDYAQEYLRRLKPISFHKHYEVDPYEIYDQYLKEEVDGATENSNFHSVLSVPNEHDEF